MKNLIKGGLTLRGGIKGAKKGYDSDQLHADVRDSIGLEEEKGFKRHLGKIVGVGSGVGGALAGGYLAKKAGLRMGGLGTTIGMGLGGSLGSKYGVRALDKYRRGINEKELELKKQSFFGKVSADKKTIDEIVSLIKGGQSVDQSTEETLFLYANQYFNELTTLHHKPKRVNLKSLDDAYRVALTSAKINGYPKIVKNLKEWNDGFLEQVAETKTHSNTTTDILLGIGLTTLFGLAIYGAVRANRKKKDALRSLAEKIQTSFNTKEWKNQRDAMTLRKCTTQMVKMLDYVINSFTYESAIMRAELKILRRSFNDAIVAINISSPTPAEDLESLQEFYDGIEELYEKYISYLLSKGL